MKCELCGHRWWLHHQNEKGTHWVCDGECYPCECVRMVYESYSDEEMNE